MPLKPFFDSKNNLFSVESLNIINYKKSTITDLIANDGIFVL